MNTTRSIFLVFSRDAQTTPYPIGAVDTLSISISLPLPSSTEASSISASLTNVGLHHLHSPLQNIAFEEKVKA